MRLAITLTTLLVLGGAAAAAEMKWNDPGCSYRLTFDPRKVDRDALKGTIDLLFNEQPFVPGDMFHTPEQAARVDTGKLQRECGALVERRERLKLLPLPGLESFRSALIEDARDSCDMNRATLRAINDPAALRDYKPAFPACGEYADAIEGKADLDRVWSRMLDESCRENVQPAACLKRYQADAQKPDGTLRKRLYVLNFGWNNCAVRYVRHNAMSEARDAARNEIVKKLKAQFKVRSRCEEGD